jgi:hypothetical protein
LTVDKLNISLSLSLSLTLVRRGKIVLGYSDSELATLGGYDLVHYDDLSYIASAHQEREFRSNDFDASFYSLIQSDK